MAKETEFDRFDRRKRFEKNLSLHKMKEFDDDFEYDKKKGGKNKVGEDTFSKKRPKREIIYDSEYENIL